MALDEKLNKRIRELLPAGLKVAEKKMFSGTVFMVNDKMCITASDEHIMCRINPEKDNEVLQHKGCTQVIMRGHPMKGFVYVDKEMIKTKKQLQYWLNLCLDFNSEAKSSKKKK